MQRPQLMAALLMAAGLVGVPAAASAQVMTEDQQLARMAAVAESAEQHTRVADAYRDRATSLEREAGRLEKKARQLEQRWYPHEYKAAPMHRAGYRERQAAIRARKGAQSMRQLADHHEKSSLQIRNAPE